MTPKRICHLRLNCSRTPLSRAAMMWASVAWGTACALPSTTSYANGMTREESEFVASVVARNSTWHLATATDSQNQKSIDELRSANPTYQPYFCRSSDGKLVSGFVLARADTFRVVYARSEEASSISMDEAARMTWLNDGQITCREDGIEIAPFHSDEVLSFRWNADQKRLELLKEDPSAFDDPA